MSGGTFLVVMLAVLVGGVAARPIEKRDEADYIIIGTVDAVYARETRGYREYVVEIKVEAVEKGPGINKGDIFRAFCYQRKEGAGGIEFDSAGHDTVPREGQRVKVFVDRSGGRNVGIYPDWVDVLPKALR